METPKFSDHTLEERIPIIGGVGEYRSLEVTAPQFIKLDNVTRRLELNTKSVPEDFVSGGHIFLKIKNFSLLAPSESDQNALKKLFPNIFKHHQTTMYEYSGEFDSIGINLEAIYATAKEYFDQRPSQASALKQKKALRKYVQHVSELYPFSETRGERILQLTSWIATDLIIYYAALSRLRWDQYFIQGLEETAPLRVGGALIAVGMDELIGSLLGFRPSLPRSIIAGLIAEDISRQTVSKGIKDKLEKITEEFRQQIIPGGPLVKIS